MDQLTFIVELLKALGWPVAIIILGLILKVPITRLLSLINKIKYGDFEAEFAQKFRLVDEEAEAIPIKINKSSAKKVKPDGMDLFYNNLVEIVKQSPVAALLEAWRNIEIELARIYYSRHPQEKRISTYLKIDRLHSEEIIDSEMKSLLKQMKNLRNEVAHSNLKIAIEEVQAATYIQSAMKAMRILKEIK